MGSEMCIRDRDRLEQSNARIFVTDSTGQVWVSDDPTAGIKMPQKIDVDPTAQRPSISQLFSAPDRNRILEQSEGWIASRITLDPSNPQTTVGLIIELDD